MVFNLGSSIPEGAVGDGGLHDLHHRPQRNAAAEALGGVAGTLKVQPSDVHARVYSILDQVRQLEREIALLKSKHVAVQGDSLAAGAVEVKLTVCGTLATANDCWTWVAAA